MPRILHRSYKLENLYYLHPTADDYYIKPICPSGGHGRGHRLALQNRAAARHVPLTVKVLRDLP